MQTMITEAYRNTADGAEAERILRTCVHCGFCTATCPTYQLLGDELDGPRGRIYQIKQLLEGQEPSTTERLHLDRCLTCRSCESTCPSGVDYGRLLEIGRQIVEPTRSVPGKIVRKLMLTVLPYPERFGPAARLGASFRFLVPGKLKGKIPKPGQKAGNWPGQSHARQVAILSGCVQPTLEPGIDTAFARLLDHVGIQAIPVRNRCCGALPAHLSDEERAELLAIETIDRLWPHVEQGLEAVISTASGCGATLKEYDWLLRHRAEYLDMAQRIVELVADPIEVIEREQDKLDAGLGMGRKIVFHPPCTLQHGMKLKSRVENLLSAVGFELLPFRDAHLCCGSAGVYSLFQPAISSALRDRKLDELGQPGAEVIATANIGCMTHLQEQSSLPVVHWLSLMEEAIN